MNTKIITAVAPLILFVATSLKAELQNSTPPPLIAESTWTRASDGKTITSAVIHVREGAVVFSGHGGRWFAVDPETLIEADQVRVADAKIYAPKFPVARLWMTEKSQLEILLGKPKAIEGPYWSWLINGKTYSVRTGEKFAEHFSTSSIGPYADDLILRMLGLNHLHPGSKSFKGQVHSFFLTSLDGIWRFQGTLPINNSDDTYGVVNVDFPEP